MPTVSLIGRGALSSAADRIKAMGLRKALVVTDAGLLAAGAVTAITDVLDKVGVAYSIYAGCEPNPTVQQVEAGKAQFVAEGCDCVISFGGGSPHDCAKGIAIIASPDNSDDVRDFEGVDKMTGPMVPLYACNTTAGTASEMTRFAILTDPARKVKMVRLFFSRRSRPPPPPAATVPFPAPHVTTFSSSSPHPPPTSSQAIIDARCTPLLAINDSLLMQAMPPALTAATGMDALTHAVEAYVSTASTPLTDACALQAIKLVSKFLRRAVHTPNDLEARDGMAWAEFAAGCAFNSAGLGYVHALAHALGGAKNLPHGVCNAVLLPAVQEFNAAACPDLFIDIADALGVGAPGMAARDAVDAVLKEIRQLSADVAIPPNLAALGVVPADFDLLADNAMKDACGATNPRAPTRDEVLGLLKAAHEQ